MGRSACRLAVLLCAGLGLIGGSSALAGAEGPVPYRDLSGLGAGFFGPGREDPEPQGPVSVRIGAIGPARRPEGRRFRAGVELAIAEANRRGGFRGIPYEVVYRPDDGPWGTGVKQITALAYEDSVWAIVGGLEGGDAHLAELIAAKLWIPVVTPTASDMTIDYANVPWVFRCFPTDDRQAEALVRYASGRGCDGLAVYFEADREGRTGLRRLEEAAAAAELRLTWIRPFPPSDPRTAVSARGFGSPEMTLIWGRSEAGLSVLRELREIGYRGTVLAPATLLSPELLEHPEGVGTLVVAAPYELDRRDERMREYRRLYREEVGEDPDPVALFGYDAASLVIAAVERAGLNRARIRDALARIEFPGIAGTFRFGPLGGANLAPVLMTTAQGGWTKPGPRGGG